MESSNDSIRKIKSTNKKSKYYPTINIDDYSSNPNFYDFEKENLFINTDIGYSLRTYIHYSKNCIKNTNYDNSNLSISDVIEIFQNEPISNIDDDSDDEQKYYNTGRFVFETTEGFADSIPSESIEPIRNHPKATTNSAQHTENTLSNDSRVDRAKSYNSSFIPVFSRTPRHTSNVNVPMVIVVHVTRYYRPVYIEFPDEQFPKIHFFSCPNYRKSVFAQIPTEMPPPFNPNSLIFAPPKIEQCELCRLPVKDPIEHRNSEMHKRRTLDAKWDLIDNIIKETKENLYSWPFQQLPNHRTLSEKNSI